MGTPPPIAIANLGMADSIILMVLALVVFGPRRLPQIGKQIGKLMYEFRKASNDFKFQMEEELRASEEADRRKKEEERQNALAAAPQPAQLEQSTKIEPETAAGGAAEAPRPYVYRNPYEDPYQNSYEGSHSNTFADETTNPDTPAETTSKADAAPEVEKQLESAAASEPEAAMEPTAGPRILPPSTGEKVAAERPSNVPGQPRLDFAPEDKSGSAEHAPESASAEGKRSEPAAHHG